MISNCYKIEHYAVEPKNKFDKIHVIGFRDVRDYKNTFI